MPLTKKQFAELVRSLGPGATREEILAAAQEAEKGVTLTPEDLRPPRLPEPPRTSPMSILGAPSHATGRAIEALMERPGSLRAAIEGGAKGLAEGLVTPAAEQISPSQVLAERTGQDPGLIGRMFIDALASPETVAGVVSAVPRAAVPRLGRALGQGAQEADTFLDASRGVATGSGPSRPLSDAEVIDAALAALENSTGATINRFRGDLAGQPYYAVGKFPQYSREVPTVTREELQAFIDANRPFLDDPEHSLGIWAPKGQPATLDVSGTPARIGEALEIAQRKPKGPVGVLSRGSAIPEQAIYDLRFAKRELPDAEKALGDIKVRPNLPPWLNALLDQERGSLSLTGVRPRKGARVESGPELPFDASGTPGLATPKSPRPSVGEVRPTRRPQLPNQPFPPSEALDELYRQGQDAAKWYDETRDALTRMLGQARAEALIKALAATSPNSSVKANVTQAIKALEQLEAGEEFSGFMGNVIKDLKKAAAGDEFGGLKVKNFAKALLGDEDAVVVDRWVMRAFGFPEGKAPSPKVYEQISNVIRERAKALGVTPRQYQAAIWKGAKDTAGRAGDTAAPFEQIFHEVAGQRPLFNPEGLKRLFPSKKITLEHRTKVGDLKEVDPRFYGTSGRSNSEMRRKQAFPDYWVNRAYFTKKGQPFEASLLREPYIYEADIYGDEIYDVMADPLSLWPESLDRANNIRPMASTMMEYLINKKGYSGYTNPDPSLGPQMNSAVALFRKIPVRLVGRQEPPFDRNEALIREFLSGRKR